MAKTLKNTRKLPQKPVKDLSFLMQEVLDYATKAGATSASVAVNADEGFSVDVRKSEVETVSFNEDKGVSLTVYLGQKKGSASSTDTSSKALKTLVEAAINIAKVSAEDPCFGLADEALMTDTYPELDLYHPWEITPEHAIEQARDCEAHALKQDKRLTNSDGVSFSTYNFMHGLATTYGGSGVICGSRHGVSCSLIAKDKQSMQRDYAYTTARSPHDLQDLQQLAECVAKRTINRLGARKIPTQKARVLFSSRVSSSLLSSFISAISGTNLYRKNSFLVNALNQQIFPEDMTIYEQPHLLKGLGSAIFDNDGVPTRNNTFVKEGRLAQYVLGTYSARRMNTVTTANSGGVHNLTVKPNAGLMPELIKMMDRGLLITELMGQGVNILTGDYSRGASGFWVEHGEIQHPVEEITIAGNLKNMFLNLVAVGADININIATQCGSLLVEEMTIGGS
ncbi:MAG: metalloprotease PmbA [Legionellaceae bacterium]|nr:metalloprotease PmbA [Legionellaceae bacterium]HCA89740.1 metalloprotease PmbA [Legionellales bacterium]|tara:strand:- start:1647 stop:3005 length:1359 start_codon:yes stop_codon:yes gene_type:complete